MELLDYERRHIDYLLNNAHECCLFLKVNDEFPLNKPCDIVLVGNGARNTIKGGTGSGDVRSRFFSSIEQGLVKQGFNITSSKWLDEYDEFKKNTTKGYIKETKRQAHKDGYMPIVYSMGYFDYEKDYNFDLNYEGDACVYVLARNSGEGNDRKNIKGDVKLSDSEVRDILYLNKKFKKFMLVLNVGGVIDLSPVNEVSNILLLSQLGVVTGDIFASILLGKLNPSGKLTTTWAKPEDYPCFNEFGNLHNAYYKEGLYVGYRHFAVSHTYPFYRFGYGLSYSKFDIEYIDSSLDKNILKIKAKVTNTSKYSGKEVVQVYVSKPNEEIDNPLIELCAFSKTKLLKPKEEEIVEIDIDLLKQTSFIAKDASYYLLKGKYIFQIGNSSNSLVPVVIVDNPNLLVVKKVQNKCICEHIDEVKPLEFDNDFYKVLNIKTYKLKLDNFINDEVTYKKDIYIEDKLKDLSIKDLAKICCGNHNGGIAEMVGNSCVHVLGGAGETTLNVALLTKSLTMCDGPAGIRIRYAYGKDEKGIYDLELDPMMAKMVDFLPCFVRPFFMPPKNRHGEEYYQYTTAIPIGTALAQSLSKDFIEGCGNLIGEEMEIFNVDIWLAPALNIHRNILCGRNFEYYSEDPYLSGMVASFITDGVQKHKNKFVCIKHFACNNQELNRNNNNSILSERTLREIYLKGFEICIENSKPFSIMTSYNLINGVHTSESYELLNDILRCEYKYDGLIMSDWIKSGRSFCSKHKYKAPYASKNIKAGNDLTMPGCSKDVKDIISAIKYHKLSKEDLLISASKVYRAIENKKD